MSDLRHTVSSHPDPVPAPDALAPLFNTRPLHLQQQQLIRQYQTENQELRNESQRAHREKQEALDALERQKASGEAQAGVDPSRRRLADHLGESSSAGSARPMTSDELTMLAGAITMLERRGSSERYDRVMKLIEVRASERA